MTDQIFVGQFDKALGILLVQLNSMRCLYSLKEFSVNTADFKKTASYSRTKGLTLETICWECVTNPEPVTFVLELDNRDDRNPQSFRLKHEWGDPLGVNLAVVLVGEWLPQIETWFADHIAATTQS